MTDKKPEVTNDVLLADIMLRIAALETLLFEKGVFTQEELTATTEKIAQRIAKIVLEKAQQSKTVDEFVASLENKVKKSGGTPTN